MATIGIKKSHHFGKDWFLHFCARDTKRYPVETARNHPYPIPQIVFFNTSSALIKTPKTPRSLSFRLSGRLSRLIEPGDGFAEEKNVAPCPGLFVCFFASRPLVLLFLIPGNGKKGTNWFSQLHFYWSLFSEEHTSCLCLLTPFAHYPDLVSLVGPLGRYRDREVVEAQLNNLIIQCCRSSFTLLSALCEAAAYESGTCDWQSLPLYRLPHTV